MFQATAEANNLAAVAASKDAYTRDMEQVRKGRRYVMRVTWVHTRFPSPVKCVWICAPITQTGTQKLEGELGNSNSFVRAVSIAVLYGQTTFKTWVLFATTTVQEPLLRDKRGDSPVTNLCSRISGVWRRPALREPRGAGAEAQPAQGPVHAAFQKHAQNGRG